MLFASPAAGVHMEEIAKITKVVKDTPFYAFLL
jgi:hypothetical protein